VRVTLLIPLAIASVCPGQTFFTWHSVDQPFKLNDRVQLVVQYRTRTRSALEHLDQVRAGPIIRFALTPKVTLFSGYYYQPGQPSDGVWFQGQRVFGGVETRGRFTGSLQWTGRLAAERHIGTGRPDYNRYRSYLRVLAGRGAVVPYVQNEVLAVRDGFHSTRNGGGLRFRMSPHIGAEVGFLYDFRQQEWGGDRVALTTAFSYQWGD
jgi:hypothetical protein